jgi:hypothetical protein
MAEMLAKRKPKLKKPAGPSVLIIEPKKVSRASFSDRSQKGTVARAARKPAKKKPARAARKK